MKLRIDEILVIKRLADTRSKAKDLIKKGLVYVGESKVEKPGKLFDESDKIRLKKHEAFVGRGADKIAKAISEFNIDPQNKIIADVGASTGGFTDFLLSKGAKKIYAIDVGHGQLAKKLLDDPRVINLENTNIRSPLKLNEKVDFAVVDLSYISLRLTLNSIFSLIKKGGFVIVLFKPQFECGPGEVSKKGIILGEEKLEKVLSDFLVWAEDHNFKIEQKTLSPIKGKKGNSEFLLLISSL